MQPIRSTAASDFFFFRLACAANEQSINLTCDPNNSQVVSGSQWTLIPHGRPFSCCPLCPLSTLNNLFSLRRLTVFFVARNMEVARFVFPRGEGRWCPRSGLHELKRTDNRTHETHRTDRPLCSRKTTWPHCPKGTPGIPTRLGYRGHMVVVAAVVVAVLVVAVCSWTGLGVDNGPS